MWRSWVRVPGNAETHFKCSVRYFGLKKHLPNACKRRDFWPTVDNAEFLHRWFICVHHQQLSSQDRWCCQMGRKTTETGADLYRNNEALAALWSTHVQLEEFAVGDVKAGLDPFDKHLNNTSVFLPSLKCSAAESPY